MARDENVPQISDPFRPPPTGEDFVGSLTVVCRIQRTGIGVASKVSNKLPYPSVITNIKIWGNTVATGLADTLILCEVTEDNGQRPGALPAQPGDLFAYHPLQGTFDATNDDGIGFDVFNTTQSHDFDVWYPLPSPNWRLRTTIVQATAITPRIQVAYTIKRLRSIVQQPGEGIIPRGTPEDPLCVKLCDPIIIGPGPGAGGGGPVAPPPPPPPSSAGALDPAQLPLPDAGEIDPYNPDNELAFQCALDRFPPD